MQPNEIVSIGLTWIADGGDEIVYHLAVLLGCAGQQLHVSNVYSYR